MTITYRYISNSSLHIYILLHILHIVTDHYARAAQQGALTPPGARAQATRHFENWHLYQSTMCVARSDLNDAR